MARQLSQRMRAHGKVLGAFVVLALFWACGGVKIPKPNPSPSNPDVQVVFTRAHLGTNDYSIENAFISLVDSAAAHSTIRMSMYGLTRTTVADALIRAHRRGVAVQMLLDRQMVAYASYNSLVAEFANTTCSAASTTSCVMICNLADPAKACIGAGASVINHNKYAIFSKLSNGYTNVVMQTSHNMTASQTLLANDMIVFFNKSDLYDVYDGYWKDMTTQVSNLSYNKETSAWSDKVRVFNMPNSSTDPAIDILDELDCSVSGAYVRVAMAFFTRTTVADKLAAMIAAGCSVKVLSDDEFDQSATAAKLVGHYETLESLHSKYLIISGKKKVTGETIKKVLTGSHNWTNPSLTKHDETFLEISDPNVFSVYEANWQELDEKSPRP